MNQPAPEGARQALATGAATLLVVTIAFTAWWTFSTDADAGLVIGLAILAFIALASVPVLVADASGSLRIARRAYALGALLVLAMLVAAFSQAFGPEDETDDGAPKVPMRKDVQLLVPHVQVRRA